MEVLTGLAAGTECLAMAIALSSCVPLLADLITICGPTAYVIRLAPSIRHRLEQGDICDPREFSGGPRRLVVVEEVAGPLVIALVVRSSLCKVISLVCLAEENCLEATGQGIPQVFLRIQQLGSCLMR